MRLRRPCLAALALTSALALGACAAPTDDGASDGQTEDQLVGGTRDQRWAASGYLVGKDESHVVCGATLIAPRVVVTAAHCVVDTATAISFGTGDVGSSKPVRVVERHAHPSFHPVAQGTLDLTHALRNFDVAYLVLERAIEGVTPAALIGEKPPEGCTVTAIGYHADTAGGSPVRKSTPACILFDIKLGADPIFEVHPAERSALCVGDGDEGSPVVLRDGKQQVLVGIFAGSVTGALTDCRRGTQFLDGFESMFGYGDFLRAGMAKVAR